MNEITNKQLENAIYMAEIFKRFEETNLTVREFCKKQSIHTSKFYYWKNRYHQQGKRGLVDRRKGMPHKIKETVKQHIQRLKIKDPLKSASDISKLVEKRFNKKVCIRHIQRVLKELGINDPVGRKPGKQLKKKGN